jgi:hypothetical protein
VTAAGAESHDRYLALASASRAERARAFAAGTRPDLAELDGWEFRGWNTGWITGLMGIRKFVKAFFITAGDEVGAYGCNSRAEQNGLGGEWRAKPSDAEPGWLGFYAVEAAPAKGDRNAIFLDYGRGRNGFPMRLLRDYVVRVDPDSDELLLGKAYLALGPLQVPLSYFVLGRRRRAPAVPEFPGSR